MKYSGWIVKHNASASNKGTIYPSSYGRGLNFYSWEFDGKNSEQVYEFLINWFLPEDSRPLAGKSYLTKCR